MLNEILGCCNLAKIVPLHQSFFGHTLLEEKSNVYIAGHCLSPESAQIFKKLLINSAFDFRDEKEDFTNPLKPIQHIESTLDIFSEKEREEFTALNAKLDSDFKTLKFYLSRDELSDRAYDELYNAWYSISNSLHQADKLLDHFYKSFETNKSRVPAFAVDMVPDARAINYLKEIVFSDLSSNDNQNLNSIFHGFSAVKTSDTPSYTNLPPCVVLGIVDYISKEICRLDQELLLEHMSKMTLNDFISEIKSSSFLPNTNVNLSDFNSIFSVPQIQIMPDGDISISVKMSCPQSPSWDEKSALFWFNMAPVQNLLSELGGGIRLDEFSKAEIKYSMYFPTTKMYLDPSCPYKALDTESLADIRAYLANRAYQIPITFSFASSLGDDSDVSIQFPFTYVNTQSARLALARDLETLKNIKCNKELSAVIYFEGNLTKDVNSPYVMFAYADSYGRDDSTDRMIYVPRPVLADKQAVQCIQDLCQLSKFEILMPDSIDPSGKFATAYLGHLNQQVSHIAQELKVPYADLGVKSFLELYKVETAIYDKDGNVLKSYRINRNGNEATSTKSSPTPALS